MNAQRKAILARLEAYPTPLSRTYLRYLVAANPSARHRAIRDLARGTLAILAALATGLLRSSGRKLPESRPLSPRDWATAKTLRRLWAQARPLLESELAPPVGQTPEWRRQTAPLLLGPEADLFSLLEAMTEAESGWGKLSPLAGREVGDTAPATWDQVVGFLWEGPLAFLRRWTMVAVEVTIGTKGRSVRYLDLTGPSPVPADLQLPAEIVPTISGQVYLLHRPQLWVDLHPFCIFAPVSSPVASPDADFGHDVFYLESFGVSRVEMRSGSYGFVLPQNNLLAEIKKAWHSLDSAASPTWTRPTWGVVFIELANTANLNNSMGYEAVDAILRALDQEAALLQEDAWEPMGGSQFFPIWYRPDLLLMLLAYDEKLHPPEVVAANAEEVLRHLLVRAQKTIIPQEITPTFFLAIDLAAGKGIGQGGGGQMEIALLGEVEAAREAVRQVHSLAPELGGLGQVWLRRTQRSLGYYYLIEGAYTRVSQASFGLITQTRAGKTEFLLRFNPRHQVFNFVGGHLESADEGDPEATLTRELKEELDLNAGDYRLSWLFDDALRAVEFSKPYDAWTYYIHYFLRVELTAGGTTGQEKSSQDVVWAGLPQLDSGQLADGRRISRFPYRLLAPVLPTLTAGEQCIASKVFDQGWRPLPPSDPAPDMTCSSLYRI